MDNATRKDLLYRARAVGYPGSILDVFANYDQGRDLIAEYQQQQQQLQQQQMSNAAAQQSGLQAPQPQMPNLQMPNLQMPDIPTPTIPSPKFSLPQPQPQSEIQSQNQTPIGLVSNQSGPNQGKAIFATGGFKEGPGCPEGYFKDIHGNCVEILPQSEFRGKEYFKKLTTKEELDKCKEFPGGEGCYRDRKEALHNKELPGYIRREVPFADFNSSSQYAAGEARQSLENLSTLEQKPLTFKEFDDVTGGYGTKLLNSSDEHNILGMLDPNSVAKQVKARYAPYNAQKLEKITDPKTGRFLPTSEKSAQSNLRETFPNTRISRKELGYPEVIPDRYSMFKEGYEFPKEAANLGVEGLLEPTHIKDANGNYVKNPNYRGQLSKEGKEWVKTATEKYGINPAVIGYYNGSTFEGPNQNKTLAEMDPSVLVGSDQYSKQPIISVGKVGEQLSWAPRKTISYKNVMDEEGEPRVIGKNMTGVHLQAEKKKKKLGGPICYTCVGRKRRV